MGTKHIKEEEMPFNKHKKYSFGDLDRDHSNLTDDRDDFTTVDRQRNEDAHYADLDRGFTDPEAKRNRFNRRLRRR